MFRECVALVERSTDAATTAVITADNNSWFTTSVHPHSRAIRSTADAIICCRQRSGRNSS